jgi:hypothetical protein
MKSYGWRNALVCLIFAAYLLVLSQPAQAQAKPAEANEPSAENADALRKAAQKPDQRAGSKQQ